MVPLFKKSRVGLVALGAMALMAIAGWQFGTNGTQEVFSGKEVALENAFAGSNGWGGLCCQASSYCYHPIGDAFKNSIWRSGQSTC
jgi:hypothetical protein